jgi:hypothetical protein
MKLNVLHAVLSSYVGRSDIRNIQKQRKLTFNYMHTLPVLLSISKVSLKRSDGMEYVTSP